MQAQARQRARIQLSVSEFLVWLAVCVLLGLVLKRVTGGLSDASRWACLYVAPAMAAVLLFFVWQLMSPGLTRGCLEGVGFALGLFPTQFDEPPGGRAASTAIAIVSFLFVARALRAAFDLGQRQQERNQHGR